MVTGAQKIYDVILVDDEELTVELVTRKLRNTNLHLKSFTNEMTALTYLQNHATRVLIVDQRMPRLDGMDLLQELANGNGILATNVYLSSAAELPGCVSEQAEQLGVRVLSKDVFRNKDSLMKLLTGT